jgi:hypothetical protein
MAVSLTPEQRELADRIQATLVQASATDLRQIAEMLATKPYGELLGQTEFHVRDLVHQIGAKALETALAERKKGGTWAAATPAPTAAMPPNFTAGSRKPS